MTKEQHDVFYDLFRAYETADRKMRADVKHESTTVLFDLERQADDARNHLLTYMMGLVK